jgi:hypothetical protein
VTKYWVYLKTNATMAVKVEIDDEGMGAEEAQDAAIQAAYGIAPRGVCAQCSGWREPWSMDLGEWETEDEGAVERRED